MVMKRWKKNFVTKLELFSAVYFVLALLMYWVVAEDWTRATVGTETVSQGYLLPADQEVSQVFRCPADGLDGIALVPHFEHTEQSGTIALMISDGDKQLWSGSVDASTITSDEELHITIEPAVREVEGRALKLTIQPNETGVAWWAGNTVSAGKFDVAVETADLTIGQNIATGSLVLKAQGYKDLQYSLWYWPVALVVYAMCLLLAIVTYVQNQRGKRTILTVLVTVCKQYSYLLKQLVWRDFRVKYKSSMLGMIWSFLNPLLTMLVYYFVFSTLFKSNVEYFQVYLMSGIVLFNFYSDASSLGLSSIIDNSSLITKVYMPKVIYPLSKILSSAINLCISFIPLFLVIILSGVPLTKSMLLIPVVVGFLIMFCLGISLLLATMYVFFRDMKFLWGVLLTMWNFLTPIFYPENIIPAEFIGIYRCNPMYQIVGFMRTIVLDGKAPTPENWLFCLVAAVIPLMLGLWVFRRKQDRFVLYL